MRRYRARAHGRITQDRLDSLKSGITVEGVRYGPIEASLDKAKEGAQGANVWITLTLTEGKNREVRRVLEALGPEGEPADPAVLRPVRAGRRWRRARSRRSARA